VWVAGALYSVVGAGIFSELGTAIPRSGGMYVFSRRALGGFAGFLVGYTDWVDICAANAALAIVVGEYSAVLFPALLGREMLVALVTMLGLAALNWRGVRWGDRIQQGTTFLKTLAFVALIAACFLIHPAAIPARVPPPFPGGWRLGAALLLVMQGVIFTYDCYYYVVYSSEELRDPGRAIPRAVFASVGLIAAIYLLLNLAFLRVVPVGTMAGDTFVGGTAARAVFGALGDAGIRLLVIVSILGTINAYMLAGPRVLLTMARDGLVSHRTLAVNAGGTPTAALLLSAVVSLAFLLTKTFDRALAIISFFIVFNYGLSFISLIVLRRREPDLPRPYRAWGYPWTVGVAVGGAVLFLGAALMSDTTNSLIALGVIAASYPAYRLARSGG